jgi:hypothetical protein
MSGETTRSAPRHSSPSARGLGPRFSHRLIYPRIFSPEVVHDSAVVRARPICIRMLAVAVGAVAELRGSLRKVAALRDHSCL